MRSANVHLRARSPVLPALPEGPDPCRRRAIHHVTGRMEAVFTGTQAERTGRRRTERGQTMKYGQFIATVRDTGDYSGREEAERVTEAVLTVLRERLPEESADHLAAQLPEPLDELMRDRD